MLQKLEKEIDDVDAKIGDQWRILDRYLLIFFSFFLMFIISCIYCSCIFVLIKFGSLTYYMLQ